MLRVNCPEDIPNEYIFERQGDDNLNAFIDPLQQMLINSGATASPLQVDQPGNYKVTSSLAHQVPIITDPATFQLSNEHPKQTFILKQGGMLRVFLDAWLPWQTVPFSVSVSSLSWSSVTYVWKLLNYIPIGGGPTYGKGLAALCPQGEEMAPMMVTLGHLNRSPLGEFPVSEKTKKKPCCCEQERPALIFANTNPTQGDLQLTITMST